MSFGSWIYPSKHRTVPRRIVIEGGIGAGKTSLAKELAHLLDYRLIEEPVIDNEFLTNFYSDKKKFGFLMQVKMLFTRLKAERAGTYAVASKMEEGVVYDRSLGGDTVFVELNTRLGNITQLEAQLYLEMFEYMKIESPYPDVVIFLDVPIDELRLRIKNRGRKFEEELCDHLDEYLPRLIETYEQFCEAMALHTLVVKIPWKEFQPVYKVWGTVLERWNTSDHSRFEKQLLRW